MTEQELRKLAADKRSEASLITEKAKTEGRTELTDEEDAAVERMVGEIKDLETRAAKAGRFAGYDAILRGNGAQTQTLAHEDPRNAKGREYSMARALLAAYNGHRPDGMEGEVHDDLLDRRNKLAILPSLSRNAVLVPDNMIKRAALSTTTGSGAIQTTVQSDIIEYLSDKTPLGGLGAKFMPDCVGKFTLPKITTATSSTFVAEGASPSQSSLVIDHVEFKPRRMTVQVPHTLEFVQQAITSISAENIIRADFSRAHALNLETNAITGTGSGAFPEGVLENPDATELPMGTNGAALTYAKLLQFVETLAVNKVDGSYSWLTTPALRTILKQIPQLIAEAYAKPVWGDDDTVCGYKATVSNIMPGNGTKGSGSNLQSIILGAWEHLIVALWGGQEVVVDPLTQAAAAGVVFTSHQFADIGFRHDKAFVFSADVKNAIS